MPQSPNPALSPVDQVILPASRDIGGFDVRRALPSLQRRTVGPFIFFDAMGPALFAPGEVLDTRPHPHIGLATLTYLLEGAILHQDSEGNVETIAPGAVNLMTAGRGIVHSERSLPSGGDRMTGFQIWLGLPQAFEETAPRFEHLDARSLPLIEGDGASLRLLAGRLEGAEAPTTTFSETLYADLALAAGSRFRIPSDHTERALYVVEGAVKVVGEPGRFGQDRLVVLKPGAEIVLATEGRTRLMLLGGEPLDGRRHIYWNFVSSRPERIREAALDWQAGRFPSVADAGDPLPLPGPIPRLVA